MNKLYPILFLLIILISFGVIACDPTDDGGDGGDSGDSGDSGDGGDIGLGEPGIYMTGHSYDGSNFRATYWRLDHGSTTPDTIYINEVTAIQQAAYGKGILPTEEATYINGFYWNDDIQRYVPAYWEYKDDTSTMVELINDDTGDYKTYGIDFDGTNLYIAGRSKSVWDYNPLYFEVTEDAINMTSFLDRAVTGGEAFSIFMDKGTVYAAGYARADGTDTQPPKAVYWIDDGSSISQVDLTDGTLDAKASSIYVYNGNVYVTGYYENASGIEVGAYWIDEGADGQNITKIDLTDGVNDGGASTICVYEDNIYVLGAYGGESGGFVGGTYAQGAFWKNSITGDDASLQIYDIQANMRLADGKALVLIDGDVYMVGTYAPTAGGTEIAAFWLDEGADGTGISKVDLTTGNNDDAFGNAIFVVPQQ